MQRKDRITSPSAAQTTPWRANLGGSLVLVALAACTVTPLGANQDSLIRARAQATEGGARFDRECAACHGRRGEGLTSAPAVMGPGALAVYAHDDSSSANPAFTTNTQQQADSTRVPGQPKRPAFHTAQDVFDYVSTRMPLPKSRAGTLTADDYWSILNYLLIGHGVSLPVGGVNAANAERVPIHP